VFKRCALAQVVPFLIMIALGLVAALIGPNFIRRRESRPPAAPSSGEVMDTPHDAAPR